MCTMASVIAPTAFWQCLYGAGVGENEGAQPTYLSVDICRVYPGYLRIRGGVSGKLLGICRSQIEQTIYWSCTNKQIVLAYTVQNTP